MPGTTPDPLNAAQEHPGRFKRLVDFFVCDKMSRLSLWLQAIAVIASLPLLTWQVTSDVRLRRVESTISFVVTTSREYREIDFQVAGRTDGKLNSLSRERADAILDNNDLKDTDRMLRDLLAEFEWMAVGVREGGLDYDTVRQMKAGYIVGLYDRYYEYIQARVDRAEKPARKMKLYEHLEWLALRFAAERNDDKIRPINRALQ